MADKDPILQEIQAGGGTAVADEDPILAEIKGQSEKKKKEATYPVAPLEGTSNLFPSPASRTAIPNEFEGPATDTVAPKKEPISAVPGVFGQPVLPQVVQREVNKAKLARDTAAMKALDERAAGMQPIIPGAAGTYSVIGQIPKAAFPEHPLDLLKHPFTTPPISPQAGITPEFYQEHPIAAQVLGRGLGAASSFLTPGNIATIGALSAVGGVTGALATKAKALYTAAEGAQAAEDWETAANLLNSAGKLSKASNALTVVHKSVGAAFTAQFAHALYGDSREFKKAVDDGNWIKAAGVASEALPNFLFTAAGLKDLAEAGGRVKTGIQERAEAKRTARADSGLQGEVAPAQAEVVPPSEVPEDLKPAAPAPTAAVPEEPAAEEKPQPKKKGKKAAAPVEKVPEAPVAPAQETPAETQPEEKGEVPAEVERRSTEGVSPTGEERRAPKLSDIEGPPSKNVLKVVNERLAEPDLPERDRKILEAQKADLQEHPEDVEGLRGQDLGRIREEGKTAPAQKDEILEELKAASPKTAKEPAAKLAAEEEAPTEEKQRSYDDVQKDIDELEEEEGLYSKSPKMESLLSERDAIGGRELQQNLDEIGTRLSGVGLNRGEIKRVMNEFALNPNDTGNFAQYQAGEYTKELASRDLPRRVENVAIALAAEREEDFDELRDISDKTKKDASAAVREVARYFKGEAPVGARRLEGGSTEPSTTEVSKAEASPAEPIPSEPPPIKGAIATTQSINKPGVLKNETIRDDVPGWKIPEVPGLVATTIAPGKWAVTHEGSGLSVNRGYKNARAALQGIRKLAPIADWTQDWGSKNIHPEALRELGKAVHTVVSGESPDVPSKVEYRSKEEAKPKRAETPDKEKPIDEVAAEGSTLPVEAHEPEHPESAREPEPTREPERGTEPLDRSSERELEEPQSEAVRGTPEERKTERSGEESGGPDIGRPSDDGESGVRLSERVGSGEGTVHVPAERGRPAGPRREPGQSTHAQRATNDYRITDADEIGSGGIRAKYASNVSAIRTLKAIEQEGRLATPSEQAELVKYVGWGGMPQTFDEANRKWADQFRELKDLLSDEEYRAARASTPNAHYTSPTVVSAMWDALRRMGFRDGKMLEPSAGVGHFLGLMPSDISANTNKVAIELDPITGRILKQLYQGADARIQGFEKFNGRDGSFDIVAGNVPFGDYKVNDSTYNKHKLNIHNYFILKSLDKLRPGGLAALITSSSTMDSVDEKARKLFADRADLLGAIRLPNTAFKGNANTEVTTDILFFKKRGEGDAKGGRNFQVTETLPNGIRINEYFEQHPDMMLGKMEKAGTMYGPDQPALIAPIDQDLPAELQKAVAKLPENAIGERKVPDSTSVEAVADATPAYGETKQYGLKITKNKVLRRVGDEMVPVPDYPAKSVPILKGMLGIRDAVRELFEAEGKDRPKREQDDLRARLNRTYEGFVEKNGLIHNQRNEKAMQHDPDLPLLLALENFDPKTKTAKKADVFFKQTVAPRKPVERVETAKDAMMVSLSEKGRLDFDHMEKLTGKSPEELQNDLKSEGVVFHNPDGHWEPADAYLSGNVRKKLAEARDAAEKNPEYADNVKALEEVLPKDLKPSEIYARLGSSWVPKTVIKDFIGHILGSPEWGRRTNIQHVGNMGLWTLQLPYGLRENANATLKWGTKRANAGYIIEQALNMREPAVYDKDADGKATLNQPETLAAQAKMEELNDEFKRWMFEESPHADEMARIYNEHFNSEVERKWDGGHLTLPGASFGVELRPHQKNQIWRNINGGNQLVAHEVGTGKSYVVVGTAMEWRRLGKARKPLVVVPSNIVEQIAADFRRLYPEANVLMADKKSFEPENRKEFTGRIATGDWDAVVMGHSQFGLLDVSDETFSDFVNEQLDAARAMLAEVSQEEGKRGPTVKQIEKDMKRWEAKIEKRANREIKDNTVNFETLGVDGLIVDEAHYFKKLWFPTKMGRVPGVPTGDSNRAMDMYLKTRYVSKLNNGSNVVFATGTPVSNTMAEMYVMMKYLDEANLKAHGMEHFDSWAANFGQKQTKLEVRPENPSKMRMHTRFSKFVNVPELVKMFRRSADIKTVEELGLPRPKLEGGKARLMVAQPSARLMDYIQELSERADKIRGRPPEPGGDNMLNITTDGRKAATDFRLIEPGAEDDPGSKVNQAVEKIAQIYHDKQDSLGTQLVMLDMGVPTEEGKRAGRFNLYDDIKRKLVARGIPERQVRFIQEAKNNAQKQEIFDDTNAGKIRVLMGSTPLLGVGVNVQKKLYAIHHLDAPMRPSDIEQRNGRILRQGNMNPEVQENRYVTERTFDSYIWQLLENKAKFIAQVMKGDPTNREMEDVDDFALSAAEIKALSTGNPLIMRKVETDTQIQKLAQLATSHANQQFDNKIRLARIPEEIAATKETIANIEDDINTRDVNKPEKFSISVGKSSYDDRKEAGAALNEAIIKNAGSNEKKVGRYVGMDVFVRGNMDGFVKGKRSYFFNMNEDYPLGTMQSLEAALRGLESRREERQLRLDNLQKEQRDRQAEAGKKFSKQEELEKLLAQKKEIDGQLEVKDRGAGAASTAEAEEEDKKDRSGEAGVASTDLLTFGLSALYRRIMRAWRGSGAQPETPTSPESEEPSETQQEASRRENSVPDEPPGMEPPNSKAAKPGEKAINIRLDKLNSPDDVIDLIRETAKTNVGRIQFQRRGRLSDAQLKTRMEQVGLDPDRLAKLPRGKALNEAEIEVAIGIMQSEAEKIREAAKAVRENNSDENILRAQALHNRYVAIQAAVSGITAEAGRSLRTFRRIHNAVDRDDRSNYERVVESLGGRKLAEKEAQKLLEIPEEDMIGYYKFLRDHAKFTTAQKLTYYWLNNLLSSPRTPIRKLMGDATMVALNIPKTFVRAAIDPVVAKLQRRPTEYHARDAIAQTGAFFGAFPEGMKRAAFVLRNGFELEDAQEMDLPGRYELPGGYATNFPTRNLAAATAMFKIMHFKSTLAGEAMREALNSGLVGKEAANRAAELFNNPPDEMLDKSWKEARKLALVEEPDSFLRAVLRMRNMTIPQEYPIVGGLAPLRFVIPFANIGWNIGKMAVRYSPIGAARVFTKGAARSPETSNYLAEALIGSMLLAAFAQYAAGGNITGPAPKGSGASDAFYRSGKQPFSIKIGGRWVKYTGAWGVMAPMLSAIAAWHDAHEKNQKLPDTKQISEVAATIGAAATDQPLFRGVQTLMEAVTNPQGHAVENFESEAAAGFVPASSLLRTTAQALDPAVRDPQGVYERIKSGLPMLSQSVPQRIDVLGRGETHRGGEGAKAYLPSSIPEDAPLSGVDAELTRLQDKGLRNIGQVGQNLTYKNQTVKLTREEQQDYKKLRGGLLDDVLGSIFETDEYKNLNDEEKIKMAHSAIEKVEEAARKEMVLQILEEPETTHVQ